MPVLGYTSRVAALKASNQLASTTNRLNSTFQRLSSGVRINNPSDDSASLAIAMSLQANSRVFSHGILNLNYGISLANSASGALAQQSDILARLKELTTQAANGSLSLAQRQALNIEAKALTEEYNRIIGSTKFNGLSLLDGSLSNLNLQAGFSIIGTSVGSQLQRTVGDATFSFTATQTITDATTAMAYVDINGDGYLDLIADGNQATSTIPAVRIALGNADGSFRATTSIALASTNLASTGSLAVTDVNGDGKLDIITGTKNDANNAEINVLLGIGDGTFQARVSYSVSSATSFMKDIKVADLNGDGVLDIVGGVLNTTLNTTEVDVLLGNGSGTFGSATSYQIGSGASATINSVVLGDVNGDGRIDVLTGGDNSSGYGELNVLLGNGNGTLGARTSYSTGSSSNSSITQIESGDFNLDGVLDIVTVGRNDSTTSEASIFLGQASGTFATRVSYGLTKTTNKVKVSDINGDGIPDIIAGGANSSNKFEIDTMLGNADGTFGAVVSYTDTNATTVIDFALGDGTRDGALDIVTVGGSGIGRYTGGRTQTTTLQRIDIANQSGARDALSVLDAAIERVNKEQGAIGGMLNRLETAAQNLNQIRDGYDVAYARITDIDTAEEVAQMVRLQVLQQSGTAVLAQANGEPAMLLKLIQNSA